MTSSAVPGPIIQTICVQLGLADNCSATGSIATRRLVNDEELCSALPTWKENMAAAQVMVGWSNSIPVEVPSRVQAKEL